MTRHPTTERGGQSARADHAAGVLRAADIPKSAAVLEFLVQLRRLKWATHRSVARARFILQRRKRLAPLSADQVRQYRRDGYLLVTGLIPEDVVRGAEAAMWQSLGADPGAPETWAILGPQAHLLPDARFIRTYTDAMLAAAAQLLGEDVSAMTRPARGFTVNRLPVSTPWRTFEAHIDWSLPEMRQRTFPRRPRIAALTYLTDVRPHGGGTIVWPGSHNALEAFARKDPGRYRLVSALRADLGRIPLGAGVELTPSRGDVLFHHALCIHASSENVSGMPRLALKQTWE